MEASGDHRGGSKSSFIEGMLQGIDDSVRNVCLMDRGYNRIPGFFGGTSLNYIDGIQVAYAR